MKEHQLKCNPTRRLQRYKIQFDLLLNEAKKRTICAKKQQFAVTENNGFKEYWLKKKEKPNTRMSFNLDIC